MRLTPLYDLTVDEIKELFTKSSAFSFYPIYLTNSIQVDIRTDDAGTYLASGDKEYRADEDFNGVYDQPFFCFYKLALEQGIENVSAFIYFTYSETGTNQVVRVSGDAIKSGTAKAFIHTSPDGAALFKHEALVKWKVVTPKKLEADVVFKDFRVKRKISEILSWLEEKNGERSNERIINANLVQDKDISRKLRDATRAELDVMLDGVIEAVNEVIEPELEHFTSKSGEEAKPIAISPVLAVDFKIAEDFEKSKEKEATPFQNLTSIYTEQFERIFELFEFGKDKADITRTIKREFNGDVDSFIKEYVKTTNPITLRAKTLAILEYLIEALQKSLKNSKRSSNEKLKLFAGFYQSRTNRLLKKLKKTTDDRDIVTSIITHVLFQ